MSKVYFPAGIDKPCMISSRVIEALVWCPNMPFDIVQSYAIMIEERNSTVHPPAEVLVSDNYIECNSIVLLSISVAFSPTSQERDTGGRLLATTPIRFIEVWCANLAIRIQMRESPLELPLRRRLQTLKIPDRSDEEMWREMVLSFEHRFPVSCPDVTSLCEQCECLYRATKISCLEADLPYRLTSLVIWGGQIPVLLAFLQVPSSQLCWVWLSEHFSDLSLSLQLRRYGDILVSMYMASSGSFYKFIASVLALCIELVANSIPCQKNRLAISSDSLYLFSHLLRRIFAPVHSLWESN